MLFGVRYRDVLCPFRLRPAKSSTCIPLQSDGAFVHIKILAKANYLGLMTGEEVPLEPGRYPPLKKEVSREELRPMLADARRVIGHPEFAGKTEPRP